MALQRIASLLDGPKATPEDKKRIEELTARIAKDFPAAARATASEPPIVKRGRGVRQEEPRARLHGHGLQREGRRGRRVQAEATTRARSCCSTSGDSGEAPAWR